MQKTTLKAPFGWVGGKTKLAHDIIDLIPQDHNIYIEVFGGAMIEDVRPNYGRRVLEQ